MKSTGEIHTWCRRQQNSMPYPFALRILLAISFFDQTLGISIPPSNIWAQEVRSPPAFASQQKPIGKDLEELVRRARQLRALADYAGAAKAWEKAIAMMASTLGPEHILVGISINNLALNYQSQGHHSKAEALFRRAILLLSKTLGQENVAITTSLDNLGALYIDQLSYSKAEQVLLRSLEIRQRTLGTNHRDVASSFAILASLYKEQSLYDKAQKLLLRSLAIREGLLGTEHPDVGDSLNRLGSLLRLQGEYSKAESFQLRALAIAEKTYGPDHPNTATCLNDLALLYMETGERLKAGTHFQRSLAIRERALGPEHPEVGASLNNLASLLQSEGRYSKAEAAYLRALQIAEKAHGQEHPDVGTSLNNLALLYMNRGEYAKAAPLFDRSLRIRDKALGPGHADTAQTLNNLGDFLRRIGEYSKAEWALMRSLSIAEKALGSEHYYVASILGNLALLYANTGAYDKAEPLHRRSLHLYSSAFGVEHPGSATALENLALLYAQKELYTKSLEMFKSSFSRWERRLKNELPFLPLQDRADLMATPGDGWMIPFSLTQKEPAFTDFALTIRLNRQGTLQEIEQRQALLLRSSGPTQAKAAQLQGLIQQLTSLTLSPERSHALREQRDQLQVAIYRTLPDLQLESVTVQDVAKALPDDGALVEIQRFQPFDGKQPIGKRWVAARYIALILKPNGTITPVQLGAAQPIDAAIFHALQASAGNTSDAEALWGKVSQLVLQPLQPHLAGSRQWFLSPDGELNRIPFAAIPTPQQPGIPLAQAVELRLLTTGRDLIRLQQPAKPGQAPVVMANPSYDRAQSPDRQDPALVASSADRPQQRSADLNATRWTPLPATQQEGQQIAVLLGTTLISGSQATTLTLQRRQSPRVLHVATHGFFAPDQDTPPTDPLRAVQDNSPLLRGFRGEDPQLRSGLVLAGANQPEGDPNDDGYLTAAETTGLQLDGTELVTLSACSTAQGDIKTGEGVYGLQRSLTVAGARSTLLSLWKVDDATTTEFMQRYYKRLKAGEGRADALQAVQQEFRTDPALKAKGWDSIYSWGAWQLVGDWRPIAGL